MVQFKENLIAGFKKAGIYPVNAQEPLNRLPRQDRITHVDLISNNFIQKLQQTRLDVCAEGKFVRKRKVNIPAGVSICATDLDEAGPSGLQKIKQKNKSHYEKKSKRSRSSSTSSSDANMSLASSTEDHVISDDDSDADVPLSTIAHVEPVQSVTDSRESPVSKVEKMQQGETTTVPDEVSKNLSVSKLCRPKRKIKDITNKSINLNENTILTENISTTKICENSAETWPRNDIVVNDYVLITWDSRKYPGKVVSISEEAVLVSCMKKGKSFWRWPAIKDEQLYNWADVNCKIAVPKFMQKGCFKIPELDD